MEASPQPPKVSSLAAPLPSGENRAGPAVHSSYSGLSLSPTARAAALLGQKMLLSLHQIYKGCQESSRDPVPSPAARPLLPPLLITL